MEVEVWLDTSGRKSAELEGSVAVVVDVLRATTSIATALYNGATGVIPCETVEQVRERAAATGDGTRVLLAGERRMVAPTGFDVGNSPLEFTPQTVAGKEILLTTTNGTRALAGVAGSAEVLTASYVNLSAISGYLREYLSMHRGLVVVCAGREGQPSLEDTACAGAIVEAVSQSFDDSVLSDAAAMAVHVHRTYGRDVPRLFRESSHGRALARAGFERDLVFCSRIDSHPVVPMFRYERITAQQMSGSSRL